LAPQRVSHALVSPAGRAPGRPLTPVSSSLPQFFCCITLPRLNNLLLVTSHRTPCMRIPMTSRSFFAAALLARACGSLAFPLRPARAPSPAPAPPAKQARVLPGLRPGGEIRLPNQWSLRPAGRQMPLGDFPVNLALHPTGGWLAVLHAGYGQHEVTVVDIRKA